MYPHSPDFFGDIQGSILTTAPPCPINQSPAGLRGRATADGTGPKKVIPNTTQIIHLCRQHRNMPKSPNLAI
jgi:hypothetical protein